MSLFVKLTSTKNDMPYFINLDLVFQIMTVYYSNGETSSRLFSVGDMYSDVKETPEEILAASAKAVP